MLLSIPAESRYPSLNLTPQAQRAKTFEALLSHLEARAADQPGLMVLEDTHWIDPTSIEFFEQIIERSTKLPILLLITFRPEFTPPWSSHTHITSFMLNRLGQRHGIAIIERLSRGKTLPQEVVEQILAKTDGIPLFVEELTQTLLESGLLRETAEAFVLDSPLPPLAIPVTLQDSLTARLDRFASVKEVAQIGAAIGREFSHELLATVAQIPEERLTEALDQLVGAQLMFRRGSPPTRLTSSNTLWFRTPLIRAC